MSFQMLKRKLWIDVINLVRTQIYANRFVTLWFVGADGSGATPRRGSSVEGRHLHAGALQQLHRAAGETPPKRLQVRQAITDYYLCNALTKIVQPVNKVLKCTVQSPYRYRNKLTQTVELC